MGKAVAGCIPGASAAVLEGRGHDAPLAVAPALGEMVRGLVDAR
jgi:hypothetical protein